MAIFSVHVKIVRAGRGKCAVASAAYIAAEKLYDQRIGRTFSYLSKEEVVYSEIMLPTNAPPEYANRETLWNAVEMQQKQRNSQYAREYRIAIPIELSYEDQKKLVRDFLQREFVDKGMIVDWSFHMKEGNPHIHVLTTLRKVRPDGKFLSMEKKEYALDENGNKIPLIDPMTGKQKVRIRPGKGEEKLWVRKTVQANEWNSRDFYRNIRVQWEKNCNKYLEKIDPTLKIDHRSYREQGIDKVPMIHEGYRARKIEEQGGISERMEQNREIRAINEKYQQITEDIGETISEVRDYQRIIEERRLTHAIRRDETENRALRPDAQNHKRVQELDGGCTIRPAGNRIQAGGVQPNHSGTGTNHFDFAGESERIQTIRRGLQTLIGGIRELAPIIKVITTAKRIIEITEQAINFVAEWTNTADRVRQSIIAFRRSRHAGNERRDPVIDRREQEIKGAHRIRDGYGGVSGADRFAAEYHRRSETYDQSVGAAFERIEKARNVITDLDRYRERLRERELQAQRRAERVISIKEPSLEQLQQEMEQKYGMTGSIISDWKNRHRAVEDEIQSLRSEIQKIDNDFLQAEKVAQARQQRIMELSEEKSNLGILNVKKRQDIDRRISELRSAPDHWVKDAEKKIQQKKILQTKLDGLRTESDQLQKELSSIMIDKQRLQTRIDQKMGIPIMKEVKTIKRKINNSNS